MTEVFLDSSVLIGLHFRHAGEKAACQKAIPEGCSRIASRYVIFEIARGFLRSLIELHNASLEYSSYADLHLAAHSGQRRFKPYQMSTWLGAFTDFGAALEMEGSAFKESDKLDMLRAKLRGMIRRGWKGLMKACQFTNEVACRPDLSEPFLNHLGQLVQALPIEECGKPHVCGVQRFIHRQLPTVSGLATHLESLPNKLQGNDTPKHVAGLKHLLQPPPDEAFDGKKCHRCGDALICLEAPQSSIIATKNAGDFKPLAEYLGKQLSVAITAKTTKSPTELEKIRPVPRPET